MQNKISITDLKNNEIIVLSVFRVAGETGSADSEDIAIQADKKPDELEFDSNGDYIVKDELQILSKSEKKNQVKCFKTIGPFRDKSKAITYMKKLASIGILSSEPVKDSQESLNGRMALMIIDDLVERVPKYKPWTEFWLFVC